jgi:glutaryl-CoA dehydrogenase (non-decarboxylating)
MKLTKEQVNFQNKVSKFLQVNVYPKVNEYEKQGSFPKALISKMGREGYLGANIPKEYEGSNLGMVEIGILNEEFAKASSSVRSILTVQGMVALAILRWGNQEQKSKWLPKLVKGELVGAFALAEEEAGSDASNIQLEAVKKDNNYVIHGNKTWITMGQIADVFLVFAKCNQNITAFLVEKAEEITVEPIQGLLGVRASMLANAYFDHCIVSEKNRISMEGVGLQYIVSSCLDYGRYTIAWASLGICQACVDLSIDYVKSRKQFGSPLKEYQLIQKMLTNMIVYTKTVRLSCYYTAQLRDEGDPDFFIDTWSTKYLASKTANKVASQAVQIFGANGCFDQYPVERYFRDARINEIIEGTSQIHEMIIANSYL